MEETGRQQKADRGKLFPSGGCAGNWRGDCLCGKAWFKHLRKGIQSQRRENMNSDRVMCSARTRFPFLSERPSVSEVSSLCSLQCLSWERFPEASTECGEMLAAILAWWVETGIFKVWRNLSQECRGKQVGVDSDWPPDAQDDGLALLGLWVCYLCSWELCFTLNTNASSVRVVIELQ